MKKLLATIKDERVRVSLSAASVDGSLWALMYGFSEYFILPFAIYFGADAFQTSLVQGMGQLGGRRRATPRSGHHRGLRSTETPYPYFRRLSCRKLDRGILGRLHYEKSLGRRGPSMPSA